jgi:hypothetical protein
VAAAQVTGVLLDLAMLEPALLSTGRPIVEWLTAAAANLPMRGAPAEQAAGRVKEWAHLLGSCGAGSAGKPAAGRSYLVARKLQRLVREFAEMAQKPC